MSELVMFTPKLHEEGESPTSKQRGISFDYDLLDEDELFQKDSENETTIQEPIGVSYFRTFFLGDSLDHFAAISISLGTGSGFDITTKVFKSVYLLGSVSYPTNTEIGIPLKLVHNSKIGLSITPIHRNQAVYFKENSSCNYTFCNFQSSSVNTFSSLGVRTNFLFFYKDQDLHNKQNSISIKLEAGRFLDIRSMYFSFGLRIGSY